MDSPVTYIASPEQRAWQRLRVAIMRKLGTPSPENLRAVADACRELETLLAKP
jgi:hypothetical protein